MEKIERSCTFKMIQSAEEFVRLRTSVRHDEYVLAAESEASLAVWLDVISRFPRMKEWVAHNKTIPLQVLEILAQDESWQVRAVVAGKRSLTLKLFDALSRDVHEVVRQRVAYNRKAPVEVLRRLSEDGVALVRSAASNRLLARGLL